MDRKTIGELGHSERGSTGISRREFGALALGAGFGSALVPAAGAAEVRESEIDIPTPDGNADAYFVSPSAGSYPAVIVWPDIRGLRAAFRQMGKRLAESGYAVLVVNPFYRKKRAPVVAEGADYSDPPTRTALTALMGSLTPATAATDATAFVKWLDSQPSVDKRRKIGTSGYCMGGPLTMRTAAAVPERIGAGASFHGGGLVTDKPESPHLLVPKMKAHYLFAIAESDDQSEPQSKEVLRSAFAKVGLPAEIEVYAGTIHGWCPLDSKVYNREQAEKAWGRMLVLFKSALT